MPPTWKPSYKWRVTVRNGKCVYHYYQTRAGAEARYERERGNGIVMLESGRTFKWWRAVKWTA
jgi:hypothetical protein